MQEGEIGEMERSVTIQSLILCSIVVVASTGNVFMQPFNLPPWMNPILGMGIQMTRGKCSGTIKMTYSL